MNRDEQLLEEIAAERLRQIQVEGWTPTLDAVHDRGELYAAAKCYAWHGTARALETQQGWPHQWPWNPASWKPKEDRRRNLVRAGALCVAERQRLERARRRSFDHVDQLFRDIVAELRALDVMRAVA